MSKFRRGRIAWLLRAVIGEAVILCLFFWIGPDYICSRPLLAIVVGLVVCLYWPICMLEVITRGQYVKNLRIGVHNIETIERLMGEDAPFVLYVRDFKRESNIADAVPHGPNIPAPFKEPQREREILEKITEFMPVFAFSNYLDMNPIPVARRLNLVGTQWQDSFRRYAKQAALIVVNIDRLSAGIAYELDWIEKSNAWSKSFVVLPDRMVEVLERRFPAFKSSLQWLQTATSGIEVPKELMQYVRQVTR